MSHQSLLRDCTNNALPRCSSNTSHIHSIHQSTHPRFAIARTCPRPFLSFLARNALLDDSGRRYRRPRELNSELNSHRAAALRPLAISELSGGGRIFSHRRAAPNVRFGNLAEIYMNPAGSGSQRHDRRCEPRLVFIRAALSHFQRPRREKPRTRSLRAAAFFTIERYSTMIPACGSVRVTRTTRIRKITSTRVLSYRRDFKSQPRPV